VSVLGGAFLIRAFDIDKAWASWTKPTPSGFIRMFTLIAGIILLLSSILAGVVAVDVSLVDPEAQLLNIISNKILVGQFISGALPILWVGIATIFAGTFLSNWLGGISKQISDSLRLIVLASLYPTLAQFTNILINDESSFTLIPPLLVGMAVTLISAVILFKKFKKRADEELLSD